MKIGKIAIIILWIFVLAALIIPFKAQLDAPGIKGNLHTHTTYSDGKANYEEVIKEAVKVKMDFIVITDHGYPGNISPAVLERCPQEKRIICIVGEEVYSRGGDILAINIKEYIPDGLSPEETIKRIHTQGGLAIPAHPNVPKEISHKTLLEIKDNIDAVECYNDKHLSETDPSWLRSYSQQYSIPCVYNSDMHHISKLKRIMNNCQIEGEITKEKVLNAIKEGKCKPRIINILRYYYYKLT